MKIAVIGSGNIATFYATQWKHAGFEIVQVISKSESNAEQLANKLDCKSSADIRQLDYAADAFLFAVNDDVLLQWVGKLKLNEKLLIYCAGAIDLAQLEPLSPNRACLWTVYSIQKDKLPEGDNMPLVISTANQKVLQTIMPLANAISSTQYFLNDQQKKQLHLAAVFANNFTNHLYTISKKLLEEMRIPFRILHPMIINTAQKILSGNPEENQTGPAIRGDLQTMERHLNLLQQQDLLKEIYKVISASIQQKQS